MLVVSLVEWSMTAWCTATSILCATGLGFNSSGLSLPYSMLAAEDEQGDCAVSPGSLKHHTCSLS
jgi:hypothetical protein